MKMRIIDGDRIRDITPEIVADLFAGLNSFDQAQFFNHLDELVSECPGGGWRLQLHHLITDDRGLTLGGREVMRLIGEYSHVRKIPEPENEEAAPKPKDYATRYWGQEVELPPIGTLIKIEWCIQLINEWHYFWLVDSARGSIKIKGADYPDGTIKHEGQTFWVSMNEIKSLVVV